MLVHYLPTVCDCGRQEAKKKERAKVIETDLNQRHKRMRSVNRLEIGIENY